MFINDFYNFSKLQKSRNHWFLLSLFHEILWDFHENAPRIDTCPTFIDTFSMTFSVFRENHQKTHINVVVFWLFWSPISHRRRVQNTKLNLRNIDGFGMRFSKKTPKSAAWRSNRIQGFGARGRFLTQKPESGPESIPEHNENVGFRAAIFQPL